VYERSPDIADAEIAAVLRDEWRLDLTGLDYLPVGFGGHHWRTADASGRRWFVTAQESAGAHQAALSAALETATALAAAGLDFVVAPVRSAAGRVAMPLEPGLVVSVFAYHDAAPGHWGETLTAADRTAVARMLADLHGTALAMSVPVRGLGLASRNALDAALRERGAPWQGGPFAEPARALLAEHASALVSALERFDALAAEVGGDGRPLAITHGEPHPGNLMRSGSRLLLIDWDTVGLAPPERDLWWLLSTDRGKPADLRSYARRSGREVSPAALELYRLRWSLDDISLTLAEFRAPHRRTADTEVSWAGLQAALRALA